MFFRSGVLLATILLLVCRGAWASPGSPAVPEAVAVGRTLVTAENVSVVQIAGTVPEGAVFRVSERLLGSAPDSFAAPAPTGFQDDNRPFLLIGTPGLDRATALNRLRARHGLPLAVLPPQECFPFDDNELRAVRKISRMLQLPDSLREASLLQTAVDSTAGLWLRDLAEGALWSSLLKRWEKEDSAQTAREATELLLYPLSTWLLSSAANLARRHPDRKSLEILANTLDTSSLCGPESGKGQRVLILLDLLVSLPDSSIRARVEDVLREAINGNCLPSPQLAELLVSSPMWGKLKSAPLFTPELLGQLQKERSWRPDELRSALTLLLPLPVQEANAGLDAAVRIIRDNRLEGGRNPRIALSFSDLFSRLAARLDTTAVPVFATMLHDPELKRSRWTIAAIKALAATNSTAAADTLISLYKHKVFQSRTLAAMASMSVETGWSFALGETETAVAKILALGDSAETVEVTRFKVGAAMNILASRVHEIPEVEPLVLRFYDEAPPKLKDFAFDFLYQLPTVAAAERIFSAAPYIPPDRFPTDLMIVRKMPPEVLVPWLAGVMRGEISLPAMKTREYGYKFSALMILAHEKTPLASKALRKIALENDGRFSLPAFSELLQRGEEFKTKELAAIAFAPRTYWDPRIIQTVLGSLRDDKRNLRSTLKKAVKLVKKHLHDYTADQLLATARVLAGMDDPLMAAKLLTLLQKVEDPEIAAWAAYGLDRVKEGI